ncbi:DUF3995 domain-containing protein [Fictibacillus sp. WQ 8-8]|uniref:DUF3995 domain-containing protein n=1 Tax=Fictibacillus sp. WQ 8-8 TaxID=2938788 RepID=UPI00210D83D2|nr:DUF3995 domain-containing protein [Fictibacillus sp. WQ 8-8]MCQ6264702.1 DUF3995 domain-containing protein [Fictibacillus sp. WQ 8-8]
MMNTTADRQQAWAQRAIPAWPGYVGFLWALIYAVFVRFYQAAGGTIGLPGRLEKPETFYMASYVAGVVVLFAGFVMLALVKPWGKVVPASMPWIGGRRVRPGILFVPALLGSAFAVAHGVSGFITKALDLAGMMTIHFQGWEVVDVHRLILWDMLFYEPWFIVIGVLAGMAAFHYAQASSMPRSVIRRIAIFFISFVILLTALFVWAIMVLF